MRLFGRKTEKKETIPVTDTVTVTELEQFLADDKEVYEALYHAMFLDPRKIGISIGEAVEKAHDFEKEGKMDRAREWYEFAGRMAIYEGNTRKVVEFFREAERISGKKYPILKNTEKAVAKAQEYYKKQLKT
ncbi:MAG: hypothetical protein QW840_00520 [Candidatus Bathyarchaeia archaeon]